MIMINDLDDHHQVKLELPYTVAGERTITGDDAYAKIDRWGVLFVTIKWTLAWKEGRKENGQT